MNDESRCADIASLVPELPGYEVVPHLIRKIARGTPVEVQELAEIASLPLDHVEAMLRAQPGTDWDEDGRLVGFGLTLRPTSHLYTVAGRVLYTFCATDALLFTHILGESAVAESVCPSTSTQVRIELTPSTVGLVDPASAVVSQLFDPLLLGDLRHNVCDHGHFFASADAAADWAREHPDGRILTIAEAFEQARRDIKTLGWLP
jgi:alkylmercury lyase